MGNCLSFECDIDDTQSITTKLFEKRIEKTKYIKHGYYDVVFGYMNF